MNLKRKLPQIFKAWKEIVKKWKSKASLKFKLQKYHDKKLK